MQISNQTENHNAFRHWLPLKKTLFVRGKGPLRFLLFIFQSFARTATIFFLSAKNNAILTHVFGARETKKRWKRPRHIVYYGPRTEYNTNALLTWINVFAFWCRCAAYPSYEPPTIYIYTCFSCSKKVEQNHLSQMETFLKKNYCSGAMYMHACMLSIYNSHSLCIL